MTPAHSGLGSTIAARTVTVILLIVTTLAIGPTVALEARRASADSIAYPGWDALGGVSEGSPTIRGCPARRRSLRWRSPA